MEQNEAQRLDQQIVNDHDKATQYLYELTLQLLELGGSDIFITAGSPPALKVNQEIFRVGTRKLMPQQTKLLLKLKLLRMM